MNQNIDFELIWNKIHHQITDEEETQLQNWLSQDETHRQFYNDAVRYYSQGSQFVNSPNDLRKALKSLYRKAGIKTPNYYARIITLSSVAASILLFIYFQFYRTVPVDKVQIAEQVQSIVPGSNKALLILSDGTQHNLSEGTNTIITSDGTEIKNTGNMLEYNAAGSQTAELKFNTLKIPRGGEYFLVLADSTRVWLNSESTLRYPVQFAGNIRSVELTGEAYFEVTKKEGIPFIVSSGNQRVKVLGTKFDISSYPENPAIYTTLVEGSVEVTLESNPEEKLFLKPSEQSYLLKEEGQIQKRMVDVSSFIAWKDGRFVFRDQMLGDIMTTLSKWYDVQVVFANEEQKKLRFTGNLQRHADFNNILEKIEMTNEVKFEINNNLITIK